MNNLEKIDRFVRSLHDQPIPRTRKRVSFTWPLSWGLSELPMADIHPKHNITIDDCYVDDCIGKEIISDFNFKERVSLKGT